jgi:hypothetical protein
MKNSTFNQVSCSMNRENRPVVADEPVKFEK